MKDFEVRHKYEGECFREMEESREDCVAIKKEKGNLVQKNDIQKLAEYNIKFEAAQTSNAVLIGQLGAPYENEEANQTQLEVAVEMSDDTEKEFNENGPKSHWSEK